MEGLLEAGEDLIALLRREDEVGIGLDVLHKALMVAGHLEEVRGLTEKDGQKVGGGWKEERVRGAGGRGDLVLIKGLSPSM